MEMCAQLQVLVVHWTVNLRCSGQGYEGIQLIKSHFTGLFWFTIAL